LPSILLHFSTQRNIKFSLVYGSSTSVDQIIIVNAVYKKDQFTPFAAVTWSRM
jgi:hypothetical protein